MQAAIVNGQVSNNEEQNVQRSILPLWSFPPAHLLEHDELASGEEPSALIMRALSIRNIPKNETPIGGPGELRAKWRKRRALQVA